MQQTFYHTANEKGISFIYLITTLYFVIFSWTKAHQRNKIQPNIILDIIINKTTG
jgi:hypothetical protein